jgi:hypothetical protein
MKKLKISFRPLAEANLFVTAQVDQAGWADRIFLIF